MRDAIASNFGAIKVSWHRVLVSLAVLSLHEAAGLAPEGHRSSN